MALSRRVCAVCIVSYLGARGCAVRRGAACHDCVLAAGARLARAAWAWCWFLLVRRRVSCSWLVATRGVRPASGTTRRPARARVVSLITAGGCIAPYIFVVTSLPERCIWKPDQRQRPAPTSCTAFYDVSLTRHTLTHSIQHDSQPACGDCTPAPCPLRFTACCDHCELRTLIVAMLHANSHPEVRAHFDDSLV